jgi:probable F420-dependent oxidoreductase
MNSVMEIGIDVGIYGRLATPENVLGLAKFAEERNYHSIWLADHVVFPATIDSKYPYSPTGDFPSPETEPLLEPIAAMGVLAGATRNVKIGTSVLVMPYRNPLVLARMLATLDVFSNGRIVLGAGSGWLEEEFTALQTANFAARGAVTDEYLEIFKAVTGGGEISYEGEHYRFDPVHCYPPSVQRPHPPILIGGISNRALRRVAELGDGWMSVSLDPDRIPERLKRLGRLCEERGRQLSDLWLCHKLFISIGEAEEGVHGGRKLGTGSVEAIVGDIKRFQDYGYRSMIFRYPGADPDEQNRQFDILADKIMTRV